MPILDRARQDLQHFANPRARLCGCGKFRNHVCVRSSMLWRLRISDLAMSPRPGTRIHETRSSPVEVEAHGGAVVVQFSEVPAA